MTLKEKQQAGAIERMTILKLMPNVIKDFKKGILYYSERQNEFFDGILYWVSNKPKFEQVIKDFEKDYGYLVYHAQLMHTYFGNLLTLLFVSGYENEWEEEKEGLKKGEARSCVITFDHEDSYLDREFGSCGIKPKNGGVIRTY